MSGLQEMEEPFRGYVLLRYCRKGGDVAGCAVCRVVEWAKNENVSRCPRGARMMYELRRDDWARKIDGEGLG